MAGSLRGKVGKSPAAPELGLDPDAALRHLFGIPAFTQPVRPQDRHWHSWPGTELPDLAFELGFRQVDTLDSTIMRLDPDAADALQSQRRRFEDKFGRPPGPDDPRTDPEGQQPAPPRRTTPLCTQPKVPPPNQTL